MNNSVHFYTSTSGERVAVIHIPVGIAWALVDCTKDTQKYSVLRRILSDYLEAATKANMTSFGFSCYMDMAHDVEDLCKKHAYPRKYDDEWQMERLL